MGVKHRGERQEEGGGRGRERAQSIESTEHRAQRAQMEGKREK